MTYTNAQRKIIRKQLVGAKPLLWDGIGRQGDKFGMICLAICKADGQIFIFGGKNMLACKMIAKRIGRYRCIDNWLRNVAMIPKEQLTDEAVQTYRHEWLDHLIKEFSV